LSHAGVTFTNIFTFNGTNGEIPQMLVPAAYNKFYGFTELGGPNNLGGVFSIDYSGVFSNLFFSDTNLGGVQYLTTGFESSCYGLNSRGQIFEFGPDGTIGNSNLAPSFGGELGHFFQDPEGIIYGVIEIQPAPPYYGSIFKINITFNNGVLSTLANFNGTNGYIPLSLLLGADNNFYGITQYGGSNFTSAASGEGDGTIFRVDRNGNLTNIFSFNDSDSLPQTLVKGADGDLYGGTANGGINNAGTLFRITTNGVLVWSFPLNGTNGADPRSLIRGNDGNIYGVTHSGGINYDIDSGFGTFFRMTPSGSFTTLFEFDTTDDAEPWSIIQGSDGNFYGTAVDGDGFGNGAIFKLSISIPVQPSFTAITQSNGLISLKWTSVSGQLYQLQTNSSLCSTNWGNLGGPILATDGFTSASDTVTPNASLFYRVIVLP
jgi:uncharacterized repeat protein (TIGR03803 family)